MSSLATSLTLSEDPAFSGPSSGDRAVIYLRVCSVRQVGRDYDLEGVSIPAQRVACRQKAEQLVSPSWTSMSSPEDRPRRRPSAPCFNGCSLASEPPTMSTM